MKELKLQDNSRGFSLWIKIIISKDICDLEEEEKKGRGVWFIHKITERESRSDLVSAIRYIE